MMIGADEGAEPRLVQGRQLRRQADQRIDEEYLLELLRPVAAGHQQMPDLVLRIEQHHADRIERIGLAQAVDHGAQQLRQAVGAQQRQLARLGALQDGFVVGRLGRHFRETLLERLVFPPDVVHAQLPASARARLQRARRSRRARDS